MSSIDTKGGDTPAAERKQFLYRLKATVSLLVFMNTARPVDTDAFAATPAKRLSFARAAPAALLGAASGLPQALRISSLRISSLRISSLRISSMFYVAM